MKAPERKDVIFMFKAEIWKEIKGFEGLYWIGNFGTIKGIKGYLKPQKDKNGYLYVDLYKDTKRKRYMVHRLVAIHFIPNPDNKPEVNHKDGNKSNCADWNLEWVTKSENALHSWQHNLHHDKNKLHVLSIDPGNITGYAIWNCNINGQYELLECEEADQEKIYLVMERERFDIIIYEAFRLYANKAKAQIGSDFLPSQIIGVINYIGQLKNSLMVEQMASTKAFWTNDRLKKMDLYVTSDHRRDSIRHFLHWYYLVAKYGNKRDLL